MKYIKVFKLFMVNEDIDDDDPLFVVKTTYGTIACRFQEVDNLNKGGLFFHVIRGTDGDPKSYSEFLDKLLSGRVSELSKEFSPKDMKMPYKVGYLMFSAPESNFNNNWDMEDDTYENWILKTKGSLKTFLRYINSKLDIESVSYRPVGMDTYCLVNLKDTFEIGLPSAPTLT